MADGICPFATQIAGVTTYARGHVDRVGFCDHTAGGFLGTMKSAEFWNGAGVSTHFAIGRSGEVIQIVNIFDTAWAQGRLGPSVSWPPFGTMGQGNPNGYLISTEHEDAEIVNGQTRFVPGSQWTQAQYEADLRLKGWCVEEVRRVTGRNLMRFGLDSLAGHHMFDSATRAECPGRFWRDDYRGRLHRDLTGAPTTPPKPFDRSRVQNSFWWYGQQFEAGREADLHDFDLETFELIVGRVRRAKGLPPITIS